MPPGEDYGGHILKGEELLSMWLDWGRCNGPRQDVYLQVSTGKPFWNSSLFLLHHSLRISGPGSLVLIQTRLSCSLVLQSLAPGLLIPQNVLTTEMNTKPGSATTKPWAGSQALLLWLLSSEAGVAFTSSLAKHSS